MVVLQKMIEIRNLKKSYGEHCVFENLSLQIPDGKIVGVYGSSGVGKSTLAKILCGVQRPDSGAVYMDGSLLFSAESEYRRKLGTQIQMVYQQPYATLDPHQKLYAGFRELIRYHGFAKTKAETETLIENVLAEVGLEKDILSHLPYQISGGEAQRIAIARCILFRPRLLILDEATSMLDVSTQANVMAMIRRVMSKYNGSILLISHDEALVHYLCDQICIVDNKF